MRNTGYYPGVKREEGRTRGWMKKKKKKKEGRENVIQAESVAFLSLFLQGLSLGTEFESRIQVGVCVNDWNAREARDDSTENYSRYRSRVTTESSA